MLLPAEMGAAQAASKLVLMDADARNCIIESMAPRAAADTLTSMEDAVQAAQIDPGSPEVRLGSSGCKLLRCAGQMPA
jgi:Mrp family chromosome partitioning ATPase